MTDSLCADGCGEPAKTRGYSHRCYRRWHAAGFPEGGPRPPLAPGEAGRRSGRARAPEPDPYDVQWLAGAPERRVRRAKLIAADLVRCVAADDAEGVRLLLHRATDWHALAVVLAECAEPRRTALVCATLALAEGKRPSVRTEAGSVHPQAGSEASDAAA